MRNNEPILILDDDRVDAMTVKRAFKDIEVSNPINIVGNGEAALDYLRDSTNEKPCLIFVDLNMPRMNGIEFLRIVKRDEYLKMIPIVVLTTSKDEHDKIESFKQSIAGYMIKPVDYELFVEMIRSIKSYWSFSEFPERK